jgi:hypothetical protein
MTDQRNLQMITRSHRCWCGRTKESHRLLCTACFYALPLHMRCGLDAKAWTPDAAKAFDASIRYLRVHFQSLNAFRRKRCRAS